MDRPELSLQQLHAFAVLSEELHFGRAAERLGIAQPPLSQQIRRLEAKVGHPLFTRGPGAVALTAAGRQLLPAARRALDEIAAGLDTARRIGGGEAGLIRIGFAASLALTVLPGLLHAYRDRFPQVEMEIREMTTVPQVAALHEQVIDVGLLREPPDEPGLATETIVSEEFVAVLPAAHPLAAQRVLPIKALADEPFVLLPRSAGPMFHDRILDVCRSAGFEPRLGQQAVEWQTVCALVEAGLGVSLGPASIRRIRLDGVAYRRIEPNSARTTVAVAWRHDDQNPLVTRFLEIARSEP
ncbi:LysR family transcriptional regulator [Microbispora sp. ATCC PTA-5024]|uniref:LysR family transcriptional regulator n=1 Tax=Microbispora sp. ATCC PTA-5024 TaxID=316330 RepID=UPI0003DB83EA|nr:LysR family transcriptional regulator [Microbispora sp. ATCC PTA-5024]ETK33711.1 LysR family transcriptional regulator [Microbispora sp. ATCC PTA-5024]